MPIPTPEQLSAALAQHPGARIRDLPALVGCSRQAIYEQRAGRHVHPELVAILQAHARAGKIPRNNRGEAGKHRIALPPETVARLDAVAASRGGTRPLRSRVAREEIDAALRGPLPAPAPGERSSGVVLDLGAAWTALGARLGTADPQVIAGVVRAILASPKKVERHT